ncbi:hypothetical protein [Aestuariibacter salexigens]|uniref:hypothetical protein n=1 Tax=Aestuariibacter salexigens TaxID=226010 RepID=UPI000401B179|nr:hypothetical protein [Aestuariibacter salexigens]
MNYDRFFAGHALLPKQPVMSAQSLSIRYRVAALGQRTVAEFNRLTTLFNSASTRATQEMLLDKRQRLILHAVREQVQQDQLLAA